MGAGLAGVGVLAWLGALTVCDVRQRRLPNALTLPGAFVVVVAAVVAGRGLPALLGALALAGLYLAVHLVAPTAMGAGDVKLAIGVGALTGAFGVDPWVLAAVAAPLLTALWGIVVVRGRGPVPHGPSMCAASLAAVALVVL
jgi:leader peptidase (prepilin peptidase)/N-methyltransferase